MDDNTLVSLLQRVEALEKRVNKKRKQGVAWNNDKTHSVVLSKLKEFSISPGIGNNNEREWTVRGWFNAESYFSFGWFETKELAVNFLETIHAMY